MPPKRKSARLAEMEAAAPNKKVKYNDDYESDIEDDYDDAYGAVESDVEDIEPEVELDPEEIARLAAIATQEAQAARAEMRVLLSKLPNAEAEQIREIFDDAESYEQPGARYDWSKLPAEVKNLIYRYTFVSEKPVRPHVVYPNVPERRRVTKYKLGAQFLRCSKEIYAEGRPILLGENVFEITNQFRAAMGEDKARKTSTMVRKVVLPCSKASWNVLQHLSRMDNLEELTIIHDRAWYNQPIGVTTDDCARYFDNIKSNLEWFLTGHKAYKIFFVTCVGRQVCQTVTFPPRCLADQPSIRLIQ